LPLTDKIEITANSLTIDGSAPEVGGVSSPAKGMAISITTTGGVIIDNADIIAANQNGDLDIIAGGSINVTNGSHLEAGDKMDLTCTGAGCTITFTGSAIDGSNIFITADGTISMNPTSTITTQSPRDQIVINSLHGSVLLSGQGLGLGTSCCSQALATCANPNDPNCPFAQQGGQVCLNTLAELQGFCAVDCDVSPNVIQTGFEGNLIINAPAGSIDLHGMAIHVSESILLTALNDVNMANATIDNCGPKTGVFVVNSATCQIGSASLRDDDPESAPTLNCATSGVATVLGTCSSKH